MNAADLLDATFSRESAGANWELRVNKEQDYENSLLGNSKRYSMDILAGGRTFLLFLKINNIDDNPPYFRILTNPCEIKVGFQKQINYAGGVPMSVGRQKLWSSSFRIN